MYKLSFSSLFLSLMIICLAQSTIAQDDKFGKYKFVETLELGEKNPEQREYMIGIPWRLNTDKKNRIFYADRKFEGVRVYDNDGSYLQTLGRSGRGPGEFTEISDIAIRDDKLLVFDRHAMRTTVFEDLDEEVTTYRYPEKNVVTPAKTSWIEENKYVTAYRNDFYSKNEKNFLHFVDLESNEITDTAFPMKYLGDMKTPFINKWIGLPYNQLNLEVLGSNRIIVVPFFYTGTLYELRNNSGDWKVTNSFNGYVEQEKAVEYFPDRNSAPENAEEISGESAVIHQQSLGLFEKANGSLIHFSFITFNSNKTFFLEEFNKELDLIHYGPVTNISFDYSKRSKVPFYIVSVDENDQFYLFDFRESGSEPAKVKRGYFEKLE